MIDGWLCSHICWILYKVSISRLEFCCCSFATVPNPFLGAKMFTRLQGNSGAWRRQLWKSKNLTLDPSITTIISVQLVRESRLSGTPINNGDPKQDCLFANCNIVPLTRCYGCSPDLTLNLQLPKRMVSVRVRLEDLVTLEGSMSARIQTWM